MNFRAEEIKRRLRLGEDSAWEFKQVEFAGNRPVSPRRGDWADEIAAFANTDGGVLLCGVTGTGEVQGMSREQMDELERLLAELCSDSIRPPIRVGIFRRETDEAKSFLLVEVPEGYSRHESPGGNFHRIGSSKRSMASDEQLRLSQQSAQARFLWFDKQPVPETGFQTLQEDLWKPLLSDVGAADPKLALEKMGLLARDENGTLRASVAGILLCSQSPEKWLASACITATRYQGENRATGQADTQTITGPLNRQIADAVTFAIRNMRVAARKEPARVDMPEYSEQAIFEVLVNAVVHRDYSIHGSRIRLSLFADRLEIQSPGGLPNNLTVENMNLRQSVRNELLVSTLGRIPIGDVRGSGDRQFFMERRGDGVPIIMRKTEEVSGKRPEFRLINGSELCVILPAAPLELSSARVTITVRHAGRPASGVNLLALFPNKTWRHVITDDNGEAEIDLYSTRLPMTVFAAAAGFAAHVERHWIPAQGPLALEMQHLPDGGSVIFPEATGYVPGLVGRLNPIRDTHDRAYLYASNIAINEGQQQPVHFIPGKNLRLTDADGKEMLVCIVEIMGRSALVEYRFHPAEGKK